MKYVDKLRRIIQEKQSIRLLDRKNSVFLFLINDKCEKDSMNSSNGNFQFIFQLDTADDYALKMPLIIGIYNGAFGTMNIDLEVDSFESSSFLEDALSNQLAIYLTQELLYCPDEDKSYLENMIVTMGDYLVKRVSLNNEIKSSLKMGITPFQIQKIRNYITERIDCQISTGELAGIVKLSVHHFIRMFKRTTGETPQQFAKRLKLERAKELLLDSEDNIIQVGMGIGCDNASHFSQLFKSSFGITPLKYRQAYRQLTYAAS